MTFIRVPRPVFICNCHNHAWTNLTRGYVTFVSVEDVALLRQRAWTAAENKRKTLIYVRSTYTKLHREIVGAPPGIPVDHENGNGLDNRRPNIRICTTQQNSRNTPKHRDGSSNFKGVCWLNAIQKWKAEICVNYKRMWLGHFDDEVEAATVYDKAALKHFGPYARLNFPQA
jgi:hypothetical protein